MILDFDKEDILDALSVVESDIGIAVGGIRDLMEQYMTIETGRVRIVKSLPLIGGVGASIAVRAQNGALILDLSVPDIFGIVRHKIGDLILRKLAPVKMLTACRVGGDLAISIPGIYIESVSLSPDAVNMSSRIA